MSSALAFDQEASQDNQGEQGRYANSIPPAIKSLLQDLSNIRMTMLVESPQSLPLIAPCLIEAEVHVRQLWQSQI